MDVTLKSDLLSMQGGVLRINVSKFSWHAMELKQSQDMRWNNRIITCAQSSAVFCGVWDFTLFRLVLKFQQVSTIVHHVRTCVGQFVPCWP